MTKPLGRKPIRFPAKRDNHPKPPLVNWWETENEPNKTAEKRESKKEIKEEIDEYLQ